MAKFSPAWFTVFQYLHCVLSALWVMGPVLYADRGAWLMSGTVGLTHASTALFLVWELFRGMKLDRPLRGHAWSIAVLALAVLVFIALCTAQLAYIIAVPEAAGNRTIPLQILQSWEEERAVPATIFGMLAVTAAVHIGDVVLASVCMLETSGL